MNTVILDSVTKSFGRVTAVNDLSLNVPQGSIYGFIGPNGSGKTTTLRMIMNIYYPDSGEIRVFGDEIHGASSDRIGYLPEERGLYKTMKVREVLRFYGDLKNGSNVAQEVDNWLERLDLAEWADKKVQTLSKGMSQKAQFIATIVAKPELVILDEPFSGLDPVNMDILKDAILELQTQGTTVIFSTHDMAVAEKMCDFIFMIFKGKKVLDGTLNSIQDKYGNDTIRIRMEDDQPLLNGINGVEKVNNYGRMKELRMSPGTDPQDVLTEIIRQTRITSFETVRPSLHDIFIRIAGPEAEELNYG